MKKNNIQACADAGGKNCPCHLAYSGDCIQCSIIRGEKTCDCIWKGVCIYNELKHNRLLGVNERENILCKVVSTEEIEINTYLMKVEVPKNMLFDLQRPGAYVMLKAEGKESEIFNAPISVMDVDQENDILEMIIKPRGIKTKLLMESKEISIKGPYFNGVFGLRELEYVKNSNAVAILYGLSQVNSIKIIKKLIKEGNNVEVFVDLRSTILEVVVDKVKALGAHVHTIDLGEDREMLKDYIQRNNVKLVYSGGSDRFNKGVRELVDEVDEDIRLLIPNNNLIVCGEGICGACKVRVCGKVVKSCKAQLDSREYLNTLK